MKSIKVISLYSGAGLMDCGFIHQGYEILWGCEIDPSYVEAYNYALKNHVENLKKINLLDKSYNICTIPESGVDITKITAREIINHSQKEFWGIIGGPPCQDYSIGGNNKGVTGERGRLINDYFQKVRELKPYFFVFENVDGLYRTKKHKKVFIELVNDFNRTTNYTVWYNVLNALDYGIPQDRHRVFVIGFRNDIIDELSKRGLNVPTNEDLSNYLQLNTPDSRDNLVFRWPQKLFQSEDPRSFNWPEKWSFRDKTKMNLTITEVFNDNKIPEVAKRLCVYSNFKGLTQEIPNQLEHFRPISRKFNEIWEGDTGRRSFKRLHRFRYSPAVAYGNNEVHLHPVEPRRLTVREALRLQTAPDSYILPSDMALTNKFKAIGNGVPVELSSLIAAEVKRTLELYLDVQIPGVQAV
ncbi:MAG: DNA cytosine methyltransferase [Clostridiales bacterium]|nr:DNA cytosine methyltransferase [Clostridiales bacterium]MCF8023140.1 DNA cytosine methyltransferase [Clostridiales bacterium]